MEFDGICGFLDVTDCLPDALAAFFTLAGEDWVLAQQLFPGVGHLLRQVVCVNSTFEIESHCEDVTETVEVLATLEAMLFGTVWNGQAP